MIRNRLQTPRTSVPLLRRNCLARPGRREPSHTCETESDLKIRAQENVKNVNKEGDQVINEILFWDPIGISTHTFCKYHYCEVEAPCCGVMYDPICAVNFSIFQISRGTFYKRINKNKIKQMPNPTNPSRSVRKKSRNQGDSKRAKSPVPPPARPLRFKKKNSVNFYLGKNSTTRGPVPAWYNC